jgi:hypothetical protein
MKRLLRTRAPQGALTTVLLATSFCCHAIALANTAHAQEPAPAGSPTTPPELKTVEKPASDSSAAPAAPAATDGTEGAAAAGPESVEADATSEAGSTEVGQGSGLFEASLSGGEDAAAGGEAAAEPAVSFNGYTRGDVYIGKEAGASNGEIKAAYGELSLQVRTPKETYGDGFAEARVRYGLEGERKQVFVDLREAYVNAHAGPFDLRLGQQVIVWGRADAFNPTNNITPSDLRVRSPVEDDRRVGNVGARAFLNFQPFRLEGVYMPLYLASELPTVQLPSYIAFGEPNLPTPEFRNGLGGARLHLELPAVETSVSYVYGHAPLPGFRFDNYTVGPGARVTVFREAYDHHVVGFDFSTALGDVLAIRGEAAYRRPLHYERRPWAARPDLQYVLGADRTFGSVSVIAQYMGRYVFDWEDGVAPARAGLGPESLPNLDPDRPEDYDQFVREVIDAELRDTNNMIFSQLEELQHLATVRLEWLTLHDTLSLSALGMLNFSTEEWLLAPKVAYRMTDNLTATVGAEVLGGPTGTLFGTIDAQLSAGYAELRVSY